MGHLVDLLGFHNYEDRTMDNSLHGVDSNQNGRQKHNQKRYLETWLYLASLRFCFDNYLLAITIKITLDTEEYSERHFPNHAMHKQLDSILLALQTI